MASSRCGMRKSRVGAALTRLRFSCRANHSCNFGAPSAARGAKRTHLSITGGHGVNRVARPQFEALTTLRLFLALMVVFGHHAGRDLSQYGSLGSIVNAAAPYAVSWFFVLSGFVLSYNYPNLPTTRDKFNFLALRFARLWPVHATLVLASILLFYYARNTASQHPSYVVLTLGMLHTWIPIDALNGAFNGPSWSISNEWFFYVAFLGLVPPSWAVRLASAILPIAFGYILGEGLGCWQPTAAPANPYGLSCSSVMNTFPPVRIVEFICGMLLYAGYSFARDRNFNPSLLALVGLQILSLSISIGIVYWIRYEPFSAPMNAVSHLSYRLLLAGAGLALIASLIPNRGISRLLITPWLIFGGEISYSMYMSHQPIMEIIMPTVKAWSFTAQVVSILAVIVAISSLLFLLVERPSRNFVKRALRRRRGSPVDAQPA
jgi:peptidoglycan/LPS O-acetylase OafA/YrhL